MYFYSPILLFRHHLILVETYFISFSLKRIGRKLYKHCKCPPPGESLHHIIVYFNLCVIIIITSYFDFHVFVTARSVGHLSLVEVTSNTVRNCHPPFASPDDFYASGSIDRGHIGFVYVAVHPTDVSEDYSSSVMLRILTKA